MKNRFRTMYLIAAVILSAGVLTVNAAAQCGGADTNAMSAVTLKVLKHSMLSAGTGNIARNESDEDSNDDISIVGFWHVRFISKGNTGIGIPDGTELDNGFAQWHPDHTEIMNSNRPPSTSNFCLGVWEGKGHTYKLNHFALSSQPNGMLIGPTNIREQVTLDDGGNGYTGTFTIQQFDLKGNPIGPLVTGNISAQRVTVDTTGQDLFK